MIIYRFRPDMVFDCEIEVPDGTKAIPKYHTFQAPPVKEGYYAMMQGGWILVPGEKPVWPPIPPEPTLEQLKEESLQTLAERRWAAEEAGTSLNGTTILTDRQTQAKLTAAYVKASQGDSYVIESWKFAPGVFITLNAQMIIAIADAVEAHVQACFHNEAVLSNQIVSAQTKEELLQVNINEGWPT
jgi:hypothetical protein